MLRAAIVLAIPLALAAQATLSDQAQFKLDMLSNKMYKPHDVVSFPPQEIDAWAVKRVPEVVPEGIRSPHVELGAGVITATVQVDFLKMRHARGQSTSRLMALMIEGERPLKIVTRVSSNGGRCTVFLTRVELSGVVIEGTVLDFLIQNFFRPLYPDAKINEPFSLDYNIDRIQVTPQAIRTILK
jgi:hypothetical protein